MGLPLVNLAQREVLVCSVDPDVTLKYLPVKPLTDEELAAGKMPPEPVRESRFPERWLRVSEVECHTTEAFQVTVRILGRDQQFQCTGGLGELDGERLNAAHHRAVGMGVTAIKCGSKHITDEKAVREELQKLPLRWASPLGLWILDESCGFNAPLGLGASA